MVFVLVYFVTVFFSFKISIWFLLMYYLFSCWELLSFHSRMVTFFWNSYNAFIIPKFVSSWGSACCLFPYELLRFSWFLHFVQLYIMRFWTKIRDESGVIYTTSWNYFPEFPFLSPAWQFPASRAHSSSGLLIKIQRL